MSTIQQIINGMYIAMYNRAADSSGYAFWVNQLNSTVGLATSTSATAAQVDTLASQFVSTQSSYFDATYGLTLASGAKLSDNAFVQKLYNNLGGSDGDASGVLYWVSQLAGGVSRSAMAGHFVEGFINVNLSTQPVGMTLSDYNIALLRQNTFNNKILVSIDYASKTASSLIPTTTTDAAYAAATAAISGVTADSATSAQAIAKIDAAAAANNPALITNGGGGTTVGQSFTLTTALDNFVGGAGNDTFNATYSDGGTNTFNIGDTLAGNGGIDSLVITPNIPTAATTLSDGLWSHLSAVENVTVATGAGVISIVTGAAFQASFGSGGVNLSATTSGGAVNLDTTSFAGLETVTTSSGAGAATIVTGSGVATVTATSTAGALTISGAGLATVSATTTGAGAQTIGDLIGGGAHLASVTATTSGAGAQVIHSTSPTAVTINATANGGPQTLTTGAGDDKITLGSSSSAATINAGAGADTIILGSTHTGIASIVETPGQSPQSAFDTVSNFSMSVSDTLALGTTTLLSSAQLGGGFIITSGIATASGSTLASFLAAATTSTTAGLVAYSSGSNTFVVASDGLASGAADTVVELIGITAATALGGGAAATMIHIV